MVTGVEDVKADLIRRLYNVRLAAKLEARKQGEGVAGAMRYFAPTKTGALRRSIRVEDADVITTRSGEYDFIGVKVKAGDSSTVVTNSRGRRFQNALLQEYGTKKRPASPYFYSTWRANRSRVKGAITRAIRRTWAQ